VAIVGHMGTRSIFIAEQGVEALIKRKTGQPAAAPIPMRGSPGDERQT